MQDPIPFQWRIKKIVSCPRPLTKPTPGGLGPSKESPGSDPALLNTNTCDNGTSAVAEPEFSGGVPNPREGEGANLLFGIV